MFKGVFVELPGLREIQSGSKIIVNYDSSVPGEMQGAFEYAVKIWEEVLPMTLPIKIDVKAENIRGASNLLSKVSFFTNEYNSYRVNEFKCPLSMVKSVLLQESHGYQQHRFYDEIEDLSVLEGTDMTITYNINRLDRMDFSLDGEPGINKFDFVTVALRDIAIGLGFVTNITIDDESNTIDISGERNIPFQKQVFDLLGRDPSEAFSRATSGSIDFNMFNWAGQFIGTLQLYAPSVWDPSKSLRYFIPNDNPLSKVLTYDFGTGYVMRDLSGTDWDGVFCDALDWRRDLVTGSDGYSVAQTGSTANLLPYKGNVKIGFNDSDKSVFRNKKKAFEPHGSNTEDSSGVRANSTKFLSAETPLNNFLKKYNVYSPDGPNSRGITLSVQKKDGLWDCIYKTYMIEDINVNIESLKLNYDEDVYARGTSGGLKYRLTKCEYQSGNVSVPYYSYDVKYFTRDFTPQRANIKYSRIHNGGNSRQSTKSASGILSDDEYFIDVKVGLSNVEGATRIIVEQLDEGEVLPFQYEVEDFRKGYFIANLDRELSTELTVIAYNDNGFRRSNTIVIPPMGSLANTVTIQKLGDTITFDGISSRLIEKGEISYSITRISDLSNTENLKIATSNTVDISTEKAGIYVLNLYKENERIQSYKFAK